MNYEITNPNSNYSPDFVRKLPGVEDLKMYAANDGLFRRANFAELPKRKPFAEIIDAAGLAETIADTEKGNCAAKSGNLI